MVQKNNKSVSERVFWKNNGHVSKIESEKIKFLVQILVRLPIQAQQKKTKRPVGLQSARQNFEISALPERTQRSECRLKKSFDNRLTRNREIVNCIIECMNQMKLSVPISSTNFGGSVLAWNQEQHNEQPVFT